MDWRKLSEFIARHPTAHDALRDAFADIGEQLNHDCDEFMGERVRMQIVAHAMVTTFLASHLAHVGMDVDTFFRLFKKDIELNGGLDKLRKDYEPEKH